MPDRRVYIGTIQQLMCLDLVTEKLLWERRYERRVRPHGDHAGRPLIYLPSLGGGFWNVVRGEDGEIVARVTPNSGAHNTIIRARRGTRPTSPAGCTRRTSSGRARARMRSSGRSARSRLEHPPVHRQRPAEPLLRERQRPARLRGRRPEGTRPRRVEVARASRKGPPSGTAARAMASA